MSSSGGSKITIYTGPNCHLCEQAKGLLYPLIKEWGMGLVEVNIENNANLKAEYGFRIPVIRTPDGQEKGWPFTGAQISRMLGS
ncbi:MAG: glutaredoxin family protein [Porticoccaceae bacterium]|jgi:glutaredoxin|nr:glutaredoxin family protein [Porticoccaceae bacterium]MDG1311220.1 glutaredoxin family protein [Porticoccaceae bacterium]